MASGISVKTVSGPEVTASIEYGSPLSGVVAAGNIALTQFLLDNGLCSVDKSSLFLATVNEDLGMVSFLLARSSPQVLRQALYNCISSAADQFFDTPLLSLLLPYCDPAKLYDQNPMSNNDRNRNEQTVNHPLNVYLEKRFKHILDKGHSVIVEMIINTCIKYKITTEEGTARHHLIQSIRQDSIPSIRHNLDVLWEHSYCKQPVSNGVHTEKLLSLYQEILQLRVECDRYWYKLACRAAIDMGFTRHVTVLLRNIKVFDLNQSVYMHDMDTINVLRFLHANKLHFVVRNTKNEDYKAVWEWLDELSYLSANIYRYQDYAGNMCGRRLSMLVKQVQCLSGHGEALEVLETIVNFMKCLAKEISETEPTLACTTHLVGSASEETGCVIPNEFDFLLQFKNEGEHLKVEREILKKRGQVELSPQLRQIIELKKLSGLISEKVREIIGRNECPLSIDGHTHVVHEKKFLLLCLNWNKDDYKYLPIKIDVVPCIDLTDNTPLPHHDYMPEKRPLKTTFHHDFHRVDTGYSIIENNIIANLPTEIRTGYRLAKALRRPYIIAPILPKLKAIGFTKDLEDLLRSYYLKNCVFFLTQNYKKDCKQGKRSEVDWAITIYKYLQMCLHKHGHIPHFFSQSKLFECNPKFDQFKRLRQSCCCELESMALITQQIIHVLKGYKIRIACTESSYNAQNMLDLI